MRAVDTAWAELAAGGQFRFETKLRIKGTEYTKITAPRISRPAMTAPLSVGGCYSSSLKVSILTEDEIESAAAVEVLCRLTNGTAATVCSEWVPFGTYYISNRSDKTVSGLISLECYDAMMKANAPYAAMSATTEWPVSQKYAVEEIAALMGVTIDPRTTINEGEDYVVYLDTTLSQWQVLCYIAACHGGNFVITETGALRLIPLVSATQAEGTEAVSVLAVMGDLDNGHPTVVEGVQMSDSEGNTYTAGETEGTALKIENNPYACQQICRDLLDAYYGCVYVPYTATKALYDPAAELGDHIVIGDKVSSVLWSQDLTLDFSFRGDLQAARDEEVTGEYPYMSPVMLAVKAEVSRAKSEIKQTTDSITARVEDVDGRATQIQQTVDGITLEVTEEAGADGQVYARIQLGIGPNKYSGYIQMTGNLEVSGQLSADALYAARGDIADLTVNALSTSRRILRYLARDLTDDDFVRIEGEKIEFVTGATTGATEQATLPSGLPIYWEADPDECELGSNGYPYYEGQRVFTTTAQTDWPVYVYAYTENVKRSTYFTPIDGINSAVDTFGVGDENGNNKGWIIKDVEGLKFIYRDRSGNDIGIMMSYTGFLDIFGQRRASFYDFSELPFGKIYEMVDGIEREYSYSIERDGSGRPIKITDDLDGHVCTVKWWDEA